ncbi:MAG TPA: carotenoid biosynthesis protein [Bacteroidales bacterium]|nr:carotenoid biosynthesis protein [Bacteroidales bacterium]
MKSNSTRIKHISPAEKYTVPILVLFYTVGAFGMSFQLTRQLFITMIPYVILASTILCFIFHENGWSTRTIITFLLIALISWIIEYAGVKTGKIFGSYSYSSALGLSVSGTPLIIGINWLFLVYCTAAVTTNIKPWFFQVISASLLMVAYDAVLEISAPFLNMWKFDAGRVPWNNFAAWFILALCFHILLKLAGISIANRIARYVFIIQFLFFIIVSVVVKNL